MDIAYHHYQNYAVLYQSSRDQIEKNALKRKAFIFIYNALNPDQPFKANETAKLTDKQFLSTIAEKIETSRRHGDAFQLASMHYKTCDASNMELVDAIYRAPSRVNKKSSVSDTKDKLEIQRCLPKPASVQISERNLVPHTLVRH